MANLKEMPSLERRFHTRLPHCQPKYSKYETYEARVKTFAYWPIGLNQTKTDMAEAGFFYSGVGDEVRCFHCGLEHNQWLTDEIPKNTHAKLSGSRCYYAQLMWGQRFINSCRSEANEKPQSIQSLLDESRQASEAAAKLREARRNANAEDRNVDLLCKICFDAELSILFYPCGHLMSCATCCLKIKNCAVCRTPITDTIRAILT